MTNTITLSRTIEDAKLLARLEKMRPKELSKARIVYKAIEYYIQTHKKKSDEVIELGPPTLADDIDIWKTVALEMSILQLVDATKKLEQLQGVFRDEAAKR